MVVIKLPIFLRLCKLIRMNQMEQGSSSQSDNIFSRIKRVEDYQGVISEEEQQSSLQNNFLPKQKRKSYTKKIQSLQKENDSQQQQDEKDPHKTKNIKKNCVSAKRSRQRKRLYIQLLQDKAQAYKNQIMRHRDRIAQQKEQILKITKESNPQKFVYISQKIKDSQGIATFLNNAQTKNKATTSQNLVKKTQKPKQNVKDSRETVPKQQDRSMKSAKSKNLFKRQQSQPTASQQQKINLNKIVDSFMYKFGFNGALKNDVVQFQKQNWCQLAIEERVLQDKNKASQLNLNEFHSVINSLDQNSRRIQYLVRKLREKVLDKYVAEILIDQLFMEKIDNMKEKSD